MSQDVRHPMPHPLAGQTVRVSFAKAPHAQLDQPSGTYDFRVEDWWDRVTGSSWMFAKGNPAALVYAVRTGFGPGRFPCDDEVVYGKIGPFGHIVHTSEFVVTS